MRPSPRVVFVLRLLTPRRRHSATCSDQLTWSVHDGGCATATVAGLSDPVFERAHAIWAEFLRFLVAGYSDRGVDGDQSRSHHCAAALGYCLCDLLRT